MKKYVIYPVLGCFIIIMSFTYFLYQQRNNFVIQYSKATYSQYDAEAIEDLSFAFTMDKGGYSWLVEAKGDDIKVNYKGKSKYLNDDPLYGGRFARELMVIPKIDPIVIKEHESEAVCTTDDLGQKACNLHFTTMEAEVDLKLEDKKIDSTMIRAKEEDKPIHVLIKTTNDDELTSKMASIEINPTFTEAEEMLNVVGGANMQQFNDDIFKKQEKDQFFVFDSAMLKRFNPNHYDISKDLTGIYDINSESINMMVSFDSLHIGVTVLDVMEDRMIVLKQEKEGKTYLESYDMTGDLITQLPIADSDTSPFYGTINHQFMASDEIEGQSHFKIYTYRDDSFILLDEFLNTSGYIGKIQYHKGKKYGLDAYTMSEPLKVKVWDHEEQIFDDVLEGSMYDDVLLYQQSSLENITPWDSLMKNVYATNLSSSVNFTMEENQ